MLNSNKSNVLNIAHILSVQRLRTLKAPTEVVLAILT